MDPVTGRTNFEELAKLNQEIVSGKYEATQPMSFLSNHSSTSGKIINEPWIERGPYSVGGRTRAIMYDPNDATGKEFLQEVFPAGFG
ncbi:hypothetical protein EJ377_07420 [Chryseobacterium arthrosphaerae]|uniref:Uncharacterized protein n=1 Tax=Chryseobacterium arthrosphaerae TaxID=651561 RepID=A0A3S0QIK8_9FLAO|nr:hypothetical protein EJ377_07420 [Chryseobacterium arthrosphaerae]